MIIHTVFHGDISYLLILFRTVKLDTLAEQRIPDILPGTLELTVSVYGHTRITVILPQRVRVFTVPTLFCFGKYRRGLYLTGPYKRKSEGQQDNKQRTDYPSAFSHVGVTSFPR